MQKLRTKTPQPLDQIKQHRGIILFTLIIVAAAYAIIPQLGIFQESWGIVLDSAIWPLPIAVGTLIFTFACAALIYIFLSPKSLCFAKTLAVQTAGSFAGKVLPAGIGAVSVSYLYLVRQGLSKTVSASLVATNNLLGSVGHGIWLITAVALMSPSLRSQIFHDQFGNAWVTLAIIAVLTAAGILILKRYRPNTVTDITKLLRHYRDKPRRFLAALISSMLLTAGYVTILWLSTTALHLQVDWFACLVVLTTGVLAQSVTPTPGGLGGAEVGLVAGLGVVGLDLQSALAVTLLYRVVTYWLPLLLGWVALLIVVHKKYI